MYKSNHWMKSFSYVLIAILFTGMVMGQTFGPYTSDANTVMLMHFDGDLTDASGTVTGATAVGTVSYSSETAKFGQALYLDNSGVFPNYQDLLTLYGTDSAGYARADSAYYEDAYAADTSYIVIPATAGLDLSGDYTVEFWIKAVDHQQWSTGANIVGKATAEGDYNYFVRDLGGQFMGGLTEDNSVSETIGNFVMDVKSDPLEADETTTDPVENRYDWKHITLQHDATNRWVAMATHDSDGTLLSYATHKILGNDPSKTIEWQQHPGDGLVITGSTDSLLIGMGNDKAAHAYIDEIRISNTVIEVADAPVAMISTEIWELQNFMPGGDGQQEYRGFGRIANQDVAATSYPIRANIVKLGDDAGVTSATVYYHTRTYPLTDRIAPDAAGWASVAMTQGADNVWQGDIPQQPFGTVVEYYVSAVADGGAEVTIGKDNDWFSHNYGGSGWLVARGMENTYFRFVVWRENSLVLDLGMDDLQADNAPLDASEWGATTTMVGSFTLPDDVPSEDAAGESFSSLHLTEDAPGYLEILDDDHLKSHSYTMSYWFKTEIFNDAFVIALQNGSRWEDQEPDYNGNAMGFWQNSPGMDVRGQDVPYIRMYTIKYADMPHPFVPQDIYNVETNKWYQHVVAVDYTGNPEADSIYTLVKDEDGVLIGKANFECKVPPGLMEGRFRIGHRGDPSVQYFNGNVDHVKMWNYYNQDPELWDFVVGVEDEPQIAKTFSLHQNYPNPFNPTTRITYSLPYAGEVKLTVYNVLGEEVKVLVNEKQISGNHMVQLDASDLASGMYLYKLETNNQSATRKLLLLK